MKKNTQQEQKPFDSILPDYSKRKLLTYADSMKELAGTFLQMEQESGAELPFSEEERSDYIWRKKLMENKGLIAGHLQEMAQVMTRVAKEAGRCEHMSERRFRQIAHAFKEVDIQLKNLYLIENEKGRTEVAVSMRSLKTATLTSQEVGDLLSVLLNLRLVSTAGNLFFLSADWQTFYYAEEAGYHVLTGVAKAIKETEQISGDNYGFFESENGTMTMMLSDGMGSGEKACADSSLVVELMEKFLEAGFQTESAIMMINSALVSGSENANMSTLDVCSIDLFGGDCRFVKVGSTCSYIKRQHLIDRIPAGNLPLGVFQKPDMEIAARKLQSGDYVIMFSDGILDALSRGIGEDILAEVIGGCSLKNPGEIAKYILNFCLQQCKGRIRDDMTVLVTGIWKKEED